MKASFHKIIFDKETLFRCTYIDLPVFDHPWHFHTAELELTLILESEGIRYVGDHTSRFKAGDLVLLGPNLPHLWLNSIESLDDSEIGSRAIVLQFPQDFLGNIFRDSIELKPLVRLFKLAERGISFSAKTSDQISPLLLDIYKRRGLRKWSAIFELLFQLTETDDYELLASPGYLPQLTSGDCSLMDQIFLHIRNNIENKITLQEMADIACLTRPSFCRFFKQKTGKSFFAFLNEYRINNAKRMLLEDRRSPIGHIALKSGFPSIQHFNTKFKEQNDGLTPSQYKKVKGI
jgi:AraC-like DNA-binding protein